MCDNRYIHVRTKVLQPWPSPIPTASILSGRLLRPQSKERVDTHVGKNARIRAHRR